MPISFAEPGERSLWARLDAPAARLALLALLATVLRWSTFGDPDLAADETFYHTVGLAMHHGALPYVDVWDRKPLGLFILYWAITGISPAPLAYQIAACASATLTAFAIGAIVRRWSGPQGSVLAGAVYLAWLTPLFGFGGQSPVFYNLLVACAVLLVLGGQAKLASGRRSTRASLAMLLAGLAITIKTSAVFEGVWLGLVCLSAARQCNRPLIWIVARATGWMVLGAAPSLAIALYYALVGHWPEFWHAMVTANLAKGGDWLTSTLRLTMLWQLLLPVVLAAVAGLLLVPGERRGFLTGWLVAALLGLAAVPNFYPHYALPLLVVLCVCAAPLLNRGAAGLIAAALIIGLALHAEPPFRPGQAARSQATFAALSDAVRAHDGGHGLLVYAGPAQLYPLTGNPFPTPLAFETHLSQVTERNVSHLDTVAELRRVLAARPGAVVLPLQVRNGPAIPETWALVNGYVRANCRLITVRRAEDWLLSDDLAVWGDCRK